MQEAHTMHQALAMQGADTTVKGHAMGETMSYLILSRGASWLKLHRLKQLLPAKQRALPVKPQWFTPVNLCRQPRVAPIPYPNAGGPRP